MIAAVALGALGVHLGLGWWSLLLVLAGFDCSSPVSSGLANR